jgi:hypothetical protein
MQILTALLLTLLGCTGGTKKTDEISSPVGTVTGQCVLQENDASTSVCIEYSAYTTQDEADCSGSIATRYSAEGVISGNYNSLQFSGGVGSGNGTAMFSLTCVPYFTSGYLGVCFIANASPLEAIYYSSSAWSAAAAQSDCSALSGSFAAN